VEDLVLADRPVWLLLTIAVIAIALLLVLIIKTRLHAFFSLLIVAVLTGLAAGIGVGDVIDVVIDQNARLVGEQAVLRLLGSIATNSPLLALKNVETRIVLRENIPAG
jgi:GntP family gluconate:H+ symporter